MLRVHGNQKLRNLWFSESGGYCSSGGGLSFKDFKGRVGVFDFLDPRVGDYEAVCEESRPSVHNGSLNL